MSGYAHQQESESVTAPATAPAVTPETDEEAAWGNAFTTEVRLGTPAPPAAPPPPADAESPEWSEEPVEDVHLGAAVAPTMPERVAAARAADGDPAALRAAVAGLYEEDLDAFEQELSRSDDASDPGLGPMSSFRRRQDILHAARMAEQEKVPATVVDDGSVRERAAGAIAALQTDDPRKLIDALQGMNGAETKRFHEMVHLLNNGGDKVTIDQRWDAEAAFERKLLTKLSPADYAEAMAQLDGDPVDGVKVSLTRALGESSFHRDAQARYDEAYEKLTLSEKGEIASRTFGQGAEMVSPGSLKLPMAIVDKVAERTDADEERTVGLLEKMRPADRMRLLHDEEFAEEIRPLVRHAMKGDGTLEDRWKLLGDADPPEKADRAVESEIRAGVEKRLGPDADPVDLARQTRFEVRTAQADPKTWNERLEQAADPRGRAELLAVRTEEALRGTGRWGLASDAVDGMDAVGVNLDTNRAALSKVLDDVEKDPKVAAAWSAEMVDRVPTDRRKIYEAEGLTDLQILKREIGSEVEGRDLDWVDAVPVAGALRAVTDGDAEAHDALAVTSRLDATAVTAELNQELEAMSKASGRTVTAAQIAAWNETLTTGEGDPIAVDLEIELVNAGLQPDDIAYVAGLDAERRELDRTTRAHKLVQAAERGRFGGADGTLALLADPELAEIDEEVRKARADASSSSPAQLAALTARQEVLREDFHERRKLFDGAVRQASQDAGGDLTGLDQLLDENFRVDSAVGLDEQKLARRMAHNGELDLCDWMYASTKGVDTDVDQWKRRMKGRTPEEIADAGRKFKAVYGRERWGGLVDSVVQVRWDDDGTLAAVADADVVTHLIDSETSGLDNAELKKLALGDPGQVFDPRRTDLDPTERSKLAKQALDLKMKGLALTGDATASGWMHDLASAAHDGERNSMVTAAMTETQQKDVKDWVTSNQDALETGDPVAWAELERRTGRHDAVLSAEDRVKADTAAKARAAIVEKAAELAMVPGLGATAKVAIPLAAAALASGTEWAIQGDALDHEKVQRDLLLAGGKAALGGVDHKGLEMVLSAGLDTAVDTAAIRDGRALDVFASGLLKEAASATAEKLTGDALPKDLGRTENGATTRDATKAVASALVGVAPKVLDGTASRADLVGLARSVATKVQAGKLGRHEQFGTTPAEAEAVIATHDRRTGPLQVTNEQLAGLLSKGIDPKSLTERGVPPLQVARSSPWVRDLVAIEEERRSAAGDPKATAKLAEREQALRAARPPYVQDLPPADVKVLASDATGVGVAAARADAIGRVLASGPSVASRNVLVDEVSAGKRPLGDVPVEWLSPPAAWSALQKHDPKAGKLEATDETLMQLQRLGADESLLGDKGVSADQLARVRAALALSDALKGKTTPLTDAEVAAARATTTDFGAKARADLRQQVSDGTLPMRAVPAGWFTTRERAEILAHRRPDLAAPAPDDPVAQRARAGQDWLVADARRSGPDADPFDPRQLGGLCHDAAKAAAKAKDDGVDAEYVDTRRAGFAGPDVPAHGFTVAVGPDGRTQVIDPTFAQFLVQDDAVGDRVRAFADAHPEAVERLVRTGAMPLDDDLARAYYVALAGGEGDGIDTKTFDPARFRTPKG